MNDSAAEKCGREPLVLIEEDSPRDGIQNEPASFSIEERVALIDELSQCGFRQIQAGSFVHPGTTPQMAGTEEVFERIKRKQGVVYSALVLNRKGLDRALACGVGHLAVFASASEEHSRRNANCTVEEAVATARGVIETAKGRGVFVRAGVMNAFGCRFEGAVPAERVLDMARSFAKCGADEISLADTAGLANPGQIEEMVEMVMEAAGLPLSLHLHDTFGFGLANVYAAFRKGVTRFDASCGGLGGCPFIPGAAGNVPTEDVVNLFETMGVPTGIDLARLLRVVAGLEKKLGRKIGGRYTELRRLP
jgi:hydroxymethylglutaryl-CoA lyase